MRLWDRLRKVLGFIATQEQSPLSKAPVMRKVVMRALVDSKTHPGMTDELVNLECGHTITLVRHRVTEFPCSCCSEDLQFVALMKDGIMERYGTKQVSIDPGAAIRSELKSAAILRDNVTAVKHLKARPDQDAATLCGQMLCSDSKDRVVSKINAHLIPIPMCVQCYLEYKRK